MSIKRIFPLFFVVAMSVALLFGLEMATADVASRRVQLEKELQSLEVEINAQRQILVAKQKETTSLERDVAILNAKIKEAELSMRARDLTIYKIVEDIENKGIKIGSLSDKIDEGKGSLVELVRKVDELDSFSMVEVVLSSQNISDFFSDLDMFSFLENSLNVSIYDITYDRESTRAQKIALEDDKIEEVQLREIQKLQKNKVEGDRRIKDNLLKITKGQEDVYQSILKEKEKSAASIRTELFTLRGTAAIPFEKALEYAELASSESGVRPALILGVIAEESNLGENVGTGNWIDDMHPTRDRPIFKVIAEALGLDPSKLPVSKKPWYGWGGAMGPAQFIPSTWVCYGGFINSNTGSCKYSSSGTWTYSAKKDLVRKKLNKNTPTNPWDAQSALMASALLLSDNGAYKKTREAERLAVLRYFAGWRNANKPAYAFYGNEVMELADMYQKQIDILQNS